MFINLTINLKSRYIVIVIVLIFILSIQTQNQLNLVTNLSVLNINDDQFHMIFQNFKTIQAKVYITREQEAFRMLIFHKNFKRIMEHNLNIAEEEKNKVVSILEKGKNNLNQFGNYISQSANKYLTQSLQNKMNNWNSENLGLFSMMNDLQNKKQNNFNFNNFQPDQSKFTFPSTNSKNIPKFFGTNPLNSNPNSNSNQTKNPNDTLKKPILNPANNNKFTMELNMFSDLTQLQFSKIYTMTYPVSNSIIKKIQKITSQNSKEKKQLMENQVMNIVDIVEAKKIQQMTKFKQSGFTPNQIISRTRNLQRADPQKISIDWTFHSGGVKFQGNCGSCYAFATVDAVAAINSIYFFKSFLPLSVKQVVDCNQNGLTFGCNGGFLEGAYSYIKSNGLVPEFKYGYDLSSFSCKIKNKTNAGEHKITSFKKLQPSCSVLVQELKKKPVAVGLAGYRLQFYKEGVFEDCNSYVDHAALLIGYESGLGWKLKNSWGQKWGMNGYFWLSENNNCGICENAITASTPYDQKK